MDPKLRTLLRQGERADRVGKRQAAEMVYRQATDEFPDSAEAWLGLSRAVEDEAERQAYYQRAVQLDPSLEGEQSSEEQEVNPLDAVMTASQEWLEESTRAPEASVTRSPTPPASAPSARAGGIAHRRVDHVRLPPHGGGHPALQPL